jgi:hypothetical protein
MNTVMKLQDLMKADNKDGCLLGCSAMYYVTNVSEVLAASIIFTLMI